MIRPNGALKPGMGYAPGARAMGYTPGAMGYAAGARGMGATGSTPGDFDNNELVLSALVSMGAISQSDMDDIWAGNASLDDMAVNMTMINQALALTGQTGAASSLPLPGSSPSLPSPSATPTTPTPSAAPAATAQVTPGMQLTYTAQWPGVDGLPQNVVQALTAQLPGVGLSVVGSTITGYGLLGASGIQVTISVTGTGYARVSDAQSVIEQIMKSQVGNNLTASSLTPAAGGANPNLPQDPLSWLENNAVYIALGIGALMLLNNFTGKRR